MLQSLQPSAVTSGVGACTGGPPYHGRPSRGWETSVTVRYSRADMARHVNGRISNPRFLRYMALCVVANWPALP